MLRTHTYPPSISFSASQVLNEQKLMEVTEGSGLTGYEPANNFPDVFFPDGPRPDGADAIVVDILNTRAGALIAQEIDIKNPNEPEYNV
jgi:hypothetical protein